MSSQSKKRKVTASSSDATSSSATSSAKPAQSEAHVDSDGDTDMKEDKEEKEHPTGQNKDKDKAVVGSDQDKGAVSEEDSDSDSENESYNPTSKSMDEVPSIELAKAYAGLDDLGSHNDTEGNGICEFKSHTQALHFIFLMWKEATRREFANPSAPTIEPCRKCDKPSKWKSVEPATWRHDRPKMAETWACDNCYQRASQHHKQFYVCIAK